MRPGLGRWLCGLSVLLLFCLAAGRLNHGVAYSAPPKNDGRAIRVAMITWRGQTDAEAGFMEELPGLGYAPQFEIMDCGQDPERLQSILQAVGRDKPDLIYTFGTTVTLAAESKIVDRPIVFVMAAHPEKTGVMHSLEGSGSNVAGVTHLASETALLEALLKVAPVKRIGVMYNSLEANSRVSVERHRSLCAKAGVRLIEQPVRPGDDLEASARALVDQGVDAAILPSDSLLASQGGEVVEVFNKARIPTVASVETFVLKMGALFGLVTSYEEVGREAAHLADRILRGQDPGKIPLVSPRPAYVVNELTEKKIGLVLPPEIKESARRVVR